MTTKHAKIITFEDIENLENELKILNSANTNLIQSKKLSGEKLHKLEEQLEELKYNVLLNSKELTDLKKQAVEANKKLVVTFKNQNEDMTADNIAITMKEKIISDQFKKINSEYNLSIRQKLTKNIEELNNIKKVMKLSYVIVKKLNFTSKFLKTFQLSDSNSIFENLEALSANGKLSYNALKNFGPILIFQIQQDTTFEDLLKKSCSIWSINTENVSLYDEAFNNMDLVNKVLINEFFINYNPIDSSLKPGEIVFYMIEKLKKQNKLIDFQKKSLDSKADNTNKDEGRVKSEGETQLSEIVGLVEQGKILKGITQYKLIKISEQSQYKSSVTKIDNNIVFMIISYLFIILSIISYVGKKDVYKFSKANVHISNIFSEIDARELNSLNDYALLFYDYLQILNSVHKYDYSSFYIVGSAKIRFMKTYGTDCFKDYYDITPLKENADKYTISCISQKYKGSYVYKDLGIYTYKWTSINGISREVHSPMNGAIENSGVLIDFDFKKDEKVLQARLDDLKEIADKSKDYLTQNTKAIELTFTIYDFTYDIFIVNKIVRFLFLS